MPRKKRQVKMGETTRKALAAFDSVSSWNPSKPPRLTGMVAREHAYVGLYWYSGLGYGHYFGSDGKRYWCTAKEAQQVAEELGDPYEYRDSLAGYSGTYLGD